MLPVNVQGRPFYRIEAHEIEERLPSLLHPGRVDWVTEHWTAGAYGVPYSDYQILVDSQYILVSSNVLAWNRHQHTWRRNTSNIGIAYMAMARATERNAGSYPITKEMVERAALVKAILAKRYSLPWERFFDHAYWAKRDGYPGLRWDVRFKLFWEQNQTIYEAGVRKARWYFQRLAA